MLHTMYGLYVIAGLVEFIVVSLLHVKNLWNIILHAFLILTCQC